MLTVVGMGPAGLQWLIPAAREAIAAAEALVGGSRHLQQFPDFAGRKLVGRATRDHKKSAPNWQGALFEVSWL